MRHLSTDAHASVWVCVDMCVGGWGVFELASPTGKSFRFVRACERARRGEAVWASERRFDCVARAVVRAKYVLLSCPETMPGGLSTKNVDFTQVL